MTDHFEVLRTLKEAGYEAFFVGGFVRDAVIGRKCKDIDIATAATPEQIQAVFPGAEMVGESFGVMLVKTDVGSVDVATYRVDGEYGDGRHPNSVKFTTDVKVDLARRDFTINALLMEAGGVVTDHVGGLEDLASGLIRCIGDPAARFQEDGLRLMRAIRFACQLGFTIEPETLVQLRANSWNLEEISKERISQELGRILTSGRAAYGIRLLESTLLLQYLVPALCTLVDTPQNPKHHPEGDVFTHTICVIKQLPKDCSLTLALGALFHDVGKPSTIGEKNGQPTFYGHDEVGAKMVEQILRDLKFSNEVVERVVFLVENHMKFMVAQDMRHGRLLRWIRQLGFDELLALHKMDALAGSGKLDNFHFVESMLKTVPPEVLHPEKLITGSDLIIRFNMKPGPKFKDILEAVEMEQLEGRVTTKDQALEFAKRMQ